VAQDFDVDASLMGTVSALLAFPASSDRTSIGPPLFFAAKNALHSSLSRGTLHHDAGLTPRQLVYRGGFAKPNH
jgi:hypothetical protein